MKNISREHLLNGWLKYHNITVEELLQKHTKEELQSPEWFKLYPCTNTSKNMETKDQNLNF